MYWVDIANRFWVNGMPDKHALLRHKVVFETLAEQVGVREPAVIDYNEQAFQIAYTGLHLAHRKIVITMSRLSGRAQIDRWGLDDAHPIVEGVRATPRAIREAVLWMNEEREASVAPVRGRKRSSKTIEII